MFTISAPSQYSIPDRASKIYGLNFSLVKKNAKINPLQKLPTIWHVTVITTASLIQICSAQLHNFIHHHPTIGQELALQLPGAHAQQVQTGSFTERLHTAGVLQFRFGGPICIYTTR